MLLYISQTQKLALDAMQNCLAENYEKTHPNQNFKKYLPIAFINKNIEFIFENGKPIHLIYNNAKFGNFTLKNIVDEVNFVYKIPIPQHLLDTFLIKHPNISILYSKTDDGIEHEVCKITDLISKKLIIDCSLSDGNYLFI